MPGPPPELRRGRKLNNRASGDLGEEIARRYLAGQAGGQPTIKAIITSLEMSDGSSIDVPTGGVLVFVGPNNAGKRFYLRDMFQLLTNEQTVSRMLYRLPL
jgi:hypothetical protein